MPASHVLQSFVWACVALLAVHFPVGEAALSATRGGCFGEVERSTLCIRSQEQNTAAASFLSVQGIRQAGVAISVQGGIFFCMDDGVPLSWKPPGTSIPSNAEGFMTLVSDGSWAYLSYSQLSVTIFVCTDGDSTTIAPETTTTTAIPTTTTTTVSPSESTTTTTTTSAPISNISEVAQLLASSFNLAGYLNVSVGTANVVTISAPSEAVRALRLYSTSDSHSVALRIEESVPASPSSSSPSYTAALFVVEGGGSASGAVHGAVGFALPYELVHADQSRSYRLSLVGHDGGEKAAITRTVNSVLTVFSLQDVLAGIRGTVQVKEELLFNSQLGYAVSLPLAGAAGTPTPHTTAFSTDCELSSVTLTMVNNGVAGQACTPSTAVVSYAVAGGTLQLALTAAQLGKLKGGPKSLCASTADGRLHVVAANFEVVSLAARTYECNYAYAASFPLFMEGVSPTSLATGEYEGYLSRSGRCQSLDAPAELAIVDAVDPMHPHALFTTTAPWGTNKMYACVQHKASLQKFKVSCAGAGSVTVSGLLPTPTTTGGSGVLNVYIGMTGTIRMADYVAQPSTTGDTAADRQRYNEVLTLLEADGATVRFVPLSDVDAASEEVKAEACRQRTYEEEKVPCKEGTLQLDSPLFLATRDGVLCVGTTYARVKYGFSSPNEWLRSVSGVSMSSEVAPRVVVVTSSITRGAADAVMVDAVPFDSSYAAIRFSADSGCTGSHASRLHKSPSAGSSVAAAVLLPVVEEADTYVVCVGVYGPGEGADVPPATAAFAPTRWSVTLVPFDGALKTWRSAMEGSGTEGRARWWATPQVMKSSQSLLRVFRSTPASLPFEWPARLLDAVALLGALRVRVGGGEDGGGGVIVPAAALLPDAVFMSSLEETSVAMSRRRGESVYMSTDGLSFVTSMVVATRQLPIVTFDAASALSGVTLGLVPLKESCLASSVKLSVVAAVAPTTKAGVVPHMDVSSLLASAVSSGADEYYTVCYERSNSEWSPLPEARLRVASSSLLRVDALAVAGGTAVLLPTGSVASPLGPFIPLWETQKVAWNVAGTFQFSDSASLVLDWKDSADATAAACTSPTTSTALVADLTILSRVSAVVTVDAAALRRQQRQELSVSAHTLSVCWRLGSEVRLRPLDLERAINRRVELLPLSLNSLGFLPYYAVTRGAEDVQMRLTDPRDPPITHVLFYRVAERPTYSISGPTNSATGCPVEPNRALSPLASVAVTKDAAGQRWLSVPVAVTHAIGESTSPQAASPTDDIYTALCVTAAEQPSSVGLFHQASSYFVVGKRGVDTFTSPAQLVLHFRATRSRVGPLDVRAADSALSAYAARAAQVSETQVLLSPRSSPNALGMYVATAAAAVRQVYNAFIKGEGLPLRVRSVNVTSRGSSAATADNDYELWRVEGVFIRNQSAYSEYPSLTLSASGGAGNGNTTLDSNAKGGLMQLALIGVVIVPTLLGLVAFSIQLSVPVLTRRGGARSVEAEEVFVEDGDSPLPRNPNVRAACSSSLAETPPISPGRCSIAQDDAECAATTGSVPAKGYGCSPVVRDATRSASSPSSYVNLSGGQLRRSASAAEAALEGRSGL